MNTKSKSTIARALLIPLGLMTLSGITEKAAGAAVLTSSVTFDIGTSLYQYTYSLRNTGPLDLILVSIPADPRSAVVGSSAPVGFALTFDPSGGWVNFNEDNDIFTEQTFAPSSTVAPFRFSSRLAPGTVNYTAFDTAGTEFGGTTQSPVPEPSVSLLGALLALAGVSRRSRSSSQKA